MGNIIDEQKKESKIIQEWISHPGWDIIKNELVKKAKDLTTTLIESTDPQKDVHIKAEILAINSFVEKIIAKAEVNTQS